MAFEGDGVVSNGEVGRIEDDEVGGVDDVEVDLNGTGEFAGDKVRFEMNIVSFRDSEFRESRLPSELLHNENISGVWETVKMGFRLPVWIKISRLESDYKDCSQPQNDVVGSFRILLLFSYYFGIKK